MTVYRKMAKYSVVSSHDIRSNAPLLAESFRQSKLDRRSHRSSNPAHPTAAFAFGRSVVNEYDEVDAAAPGNSLRSSSR
jgi:hypothetical protein